MKEKTMDCEKLEEMPGDVYVAPPAMSDDELLEKLLGTPDVATKQVFMKRFNAYFTVKAISSEEYSHLENRCKYPVKNKRTHQIEKKTNQEMLSNLLIVTACVKPDWNEPKLLEKYNTSDPAKVIRKRLYIGEISQLTEAIMDISGFDDGLEEAKKLIMRGGEAGIIHRLLQESNYSLFPDEIYAKPRRVRNFIYASLELTWKERKEKGGMKK